MHFKRHKEQWWSEPNLPKKRIRLNPRYKNTDPLDPDNPYKLPKPSRVGRFEPSRKWVRYNRLQQVDAGYLTPLFDLASIAQRYGFSEAGQRYLRKHILPEPFDLVRRRSVQAHHWSQFTLMAMDVVLTDLEKRGYNQFLASMEGHVALLHKGVAWMQDYYAEKHEQKLVDPADKFGVEWHE